uniref:Uncharacterized protein n=1 Tax=Aegilops tauschii TaxID=37682 RepID=M8BFQ1_AEGTA
MAAPLARVPLLRAPSRPFPTSRINPRRHFRPSVSVAVGGVSGPVLRTCKNCKKQYDPAANHPSSCRYHTAHFGDTVVGEDSSTPDSPVFVNELYCPGKQRENLKVSILVGPWILRVQAKCSSTGIVVGIYSLARKKGARGVNCAFCHCLAHAYHDLG